jgi:hypothetical protein
VSGIGIGAHYKRVWIHNKGGTIEQRNGRGLEVVGWKGGASGLCGRAQFLVGNRDLRFAIVIRKLALAHLILTAFRIRVHVTSTSETLRLRKSNIFSVLTIK